MIDSLLQVLVAVAGREVHIIARINGCSGFLDGVGEFWNLIDRAIIAHHHAIKIEITVQDILQNLGISHTIDSMNGMIARHDHVAACKSDDGLMR